MFRAPRLFGLSALVLAGCSDGSDGSSAPAGDAGAIDASAETSVTSDAAADGSDAGDSGDDGDAAADAETPATFTNVWSLLTARCVDCHRADEGPEGALDLSTRSLAYAQLVGVAAAGPSCGASGKTRVVAGDPDASLLYEKVATTPSCGNRMPEGGTLSAASIDLIRRWILAGAKDD